MPNIPPGAAGESTTDPKMKYDEIRGCWTYEGEDGVIYDYIEEQRAWFPYLDQKLLESQQAAYSVEGVDQEENSGFMTQHGKRKPNNKEAKGREKRAKSDQPKKSVNTSVYVTGLPEDATLEEIAEVFSKCGIIMEDINTGDKKIKIYKDDKGRPKGDGLVTFFKEESVSLAITLLDESELRPGQPATKIRVQQAEFKPKPAAETTGKNNISKDEKKKKQKRMRQLEKKLDWFEEGGGKRAERFAKIVVLKNMFSMEEIEKDPSLMLDLKEDVREECEKLGEVTNVILYDKSPGGIISVRYKEKEGALACVELMNGRYFAGRQITAEIYDGKTRYLRSGMKDANEEEEESERLEKFAKWLEQDAEKGETS
ncbi:uncharacterized protein VTP21DRAFT_5104 [Calcarisporiella thermophila]|uniref:uncharacterized protein n=1 Tax=Calcarisporiella thermophila TaxID=911321 RepID=UPI0037426FA9